MSTKQEIRDVSVPIAQTAEANAKSYADTKDVALENEVKDYTDQKFAAAQAETKGIATISTNPGAPTGYERWKVIATGIYSFFPDENSDPIEVETTDINSGEVYLIYDDVEGYWIKDVVQIDLTNVYTKNQINPAKNKAENTVDTLITPSTNLFSGSVEVGYWDNVTGAAQVSATWRRTTKFTVLPTTTYAMAGYGNVNSVFCYNAGGTYLGQALTTAITGGRKFTTLASTDKIAINLSSTSQNGLENTFQINLGEAVLPYQAYGDLAEYHIKASALPEYYNKTEINELIGEKPCTVTVNGSTVLMSSPWDEVHNLVRQVQINGNSFTANPVLNFVNEYLSPVEGDQSVNSLTLKNSIDDISPVYINGAFNSATGSYIGGNHGWAYARVLTKTAHGKTFADIGSRYQDTAGKIFVILRIVDANNLWIVSTNQSVDGFTYSFVAPAGTLTYLSAGTNTASITGYSLASLANMYPSTSVSEVKVLLDGKTELSGGTKPCEFVDIIDSYDVFDLPSIIDKITGNRPGGGYASNIFFNTLGADKLFRHSIVYRYLSNGTTLLFHNFRPYKKLPFTFHSFTQAEPLNSGSIYVPKTLPNSDGVTTFDLRQITPWNSPLNGPLNYTPSYWSNPLSPPDRVLHFNNDVIFHVGYLTDRGVGYARKDQVYNSLFLRSTRKIYPMGVNVLTPVEVEANDFYSCVAFRQFLNPNNNPAGRTNFSSLELNGVIRIWADYHGPVTDRLPVLENWKGRKIHVVEQEGNGKVAVIGDVVTDEIEIVSTAAPNDYGFVVIDLL